MIKMRYVMMYRLGKAWVHDCETDKAIGINEMLDLLNHHEELRKKIKMLIIENEDLKNKLEKKRK